MSSTNMDESTMEQRRAWLAELDTSITDSQQRVDHVLDSLGWTQEHLGEKNCDLVSCPVQPGHIIPQSAIQKHMQYCPLVEKGYTREELDQDQSSLFFYEKATCVVPVFLGEAAYRQVLSSVEPGVCRPGTSHNRLGGMPATMQRAQQEMSAAERLAMYDYCVEKAKESLHHVKIPEEELMLLADNKREDKNRPKSYIERMAEHRDMKRRRQSYRAKNVHTTKKSHTEIIREVINNQMSILDELCEDKESDTESRLDNKDSDNSYQSSRDSVRYQQDRNGDNSRERYRSRDNEGRGGGSWNRKERDSDNRDRRRRSRSRQRRYRSPSRERDDRYGYSDRSDDDREDKYEREGSSDRRHRHKKHKKHKHKHHKARKQERDSEEELSLKVKKEPQSDGESKHLPETSVVAQSE